MKAFLTSLLAVLGLANVQAQSQLFNKWYTFSLDPILVNEHNFANSILATKKLDWSLQDLSEADTSTVLKVVNRNNAYYYITKNSLEPAKVSVSIFYILQPGISFAEPDLSEEISTYNSPEAALKFINADTVKRPGLTYFSQKELDRLRQLPEAITISKADYKNYLLSVLKKKEEFEQYARLHKNEYGIMFSLTYLSNQTRVVLSRLGYNPLIADKQLDALNDKFKDDAELKDLRVKAFKFD
jgi:hypothetical protein